MKIKTLILLLLFITGYLIAAECNAPLEITPAMTPFAYDSNEVNAPIISWMEIEATGDYGSEMRACDPDGDLFKITPISMPIGVVWDANTNWWYWTPTIEQVGVHYFVFSATDIPPDANTAKTNIAAYLVNVKQRPNSAPWLLPF